MVKFGHEPMWLGLGSGLGAQQARSHGSESTLRDVHVDERGRDTTSISDKAQVREGCDSLPSCSKSDLNFSGLGSTTGVPQASRANHNASCAISI